MAGDWRRIIKRKRIWLPLHATTLQKTGFIPQPKSKKGRKLKYAKQESEILVRRNFWRFCSPAPRSGQDNLQTLALDNLCTLHFRCLEVNWLENHCFTRTQFLSSHCCFSVLFHIRVICTWESSKASRRRQVVYLKPRQWKSYPPLLADDLHHDPPIHT